MHIARWFFVSGVATFACNSTPAAPSAELGTTASPVVYGSDDRDEVFEHDDAERVETATESVVALVYGDSIDNSDPNDVAIYAQSLDYYENLCPGQRFADQPAAAFCSGTLIAPDLVLTAGHCITTEEECANTAFVFNYRYDDANTLHTLTSDDVFGCADLVVQHFEENSLSSPPDFAIARLDRPATGHAPAPVRLDETSLAVGTSLWLAGFPSGIPMKITDGAAVIDAGNATLTQFVSDFDTFAGNSGSGVFADSTGELVGVFNSGATDYVDTGSCEVVNVCSSVSGTCTGESSTYLFRAISTLCNSGASAPFCSCGDGVCASGEEETCCTDCGCTEGQLCSGSTCVDNPCDQAIPIDPVNATYTGTMQGAADAFNPAAGCSSGDGPDVAYAFTLTEAATLNASTTGNDTVLMLISADACGASSQLACNDDRSSDDLSSLVNQELSAGSYVVVVDSYEPDETGSFGLQLEFGASTGSGASSATGSSLGNAGGSDGNSEDDTNGFLSTALDAGSTGLFGAGASSDHDSGCALAPRAAPQTPWPFALGLLGLGLRRRRNAAKRG